MSFTPLTKDGVPTLCNLNPVLQIVQMKKNKKEKGGIINTSSYFN
jgi:hypothetical protein